MDRSLKAALESSPEGRAYMERKAAAKRSAAARARSRGPRAKGATKEERRAEYRTSTEELRAEVWIRCGGSTLTDEETGEVSFVGYGDCESCGIELGIKWEMHHVENGGNRRPKQRPGNVLALCWECHRRAHRGDLGTLAQIAQSIVLDSDARKAALRRIAKVEEARRST